MFTSLILLTIFYECYSISIPPTENLKIELPNDIKIYKEKKTVDVITCLVNKYSSIWECLGFLQIFPECLIKVQLKPQWETKVLTIKPRIYPLGIEAKRLDDKTFDEMQCLGRLKYITSYTFFSFSIFVVYKTNSKRERIVFRSAQTWQSWIPPHFSIGGFSFRSPIHTHSHHPLVLKNFPGSNNSLHSFFGLGSVRNSQYFSRCTKMGLRLC